MFQEMFLSKAPSKNKADVQDALDRLILKYTEPSRFYHNLNHLEVGLTAFTTVCSRSLSAVEFFAWAYHDAIYNSQAQDNEERSAVCFLKDATALGFDIDSTDAVTAIIASTSPSKDGICVVNDMDLCILGMVPEVYWQYTVAVRKEYAWVEDEAWTQGRSAVLKRFLEKDRLYLTNEFAARYTSQAYANIRNEYERLNPVK
jgi:predicted metal-dependent HD superfamily phosphohydrolase